MAEFGKLKDFEKENNNQWKTKVFDFLTATNCDEVFAGLDRGENKTFNIDGDKIFAIFQKYNSKDTSTPKFEAHKKFIDIQYVHKNSELILVDNIDEAVCTQEYIEEKDLVFYKLKTWSSLRLNAGDIAILYPADLHAPGVMIEHPELIEKVVVKIAVS